MHELSLARSLLDQLQELAAAHNAGRVIRAVVRIGPASGVVVDSFVFGFEALRTEHPATSDCVLELDLPPRQWRCLDCGHQHAAVSADNSIEQPALFTCPSCNSKQCLDLSSDELILQQVEME